MNNSLNEETYLEGALVQRGGTIGYLRDSRFQPRTNFCAEVTGYLKLDDHVVGYLFQITRIDEGTPR